MVGGGFKNRIQIQHGDAQSGQIIQLGGDAIERAAEKVPVSYLAVRVRCPNGLVVPILMDPTVSHQTGGVREGKTAEAVREDLIDHTAAKPQRGGRFLVDGELPALDLPGLLPAGLIQQGRGAIRADQAEMIPEQLRLCGGGEDAGEAGTLTVHSLRQQLYPDLFTGKFPPRHQDTAGIAIPGEGTDMKHDLAAARDSAKGLFTELTAGVEHKGITHGRDLRIKESVDFPGEWTQCPPGQSKR